MKQTVNSNRTCTDSIVLRPAKYAGLRRMAGDIRHSPTRRLYKKPQATNYLAKKTYGGDRARTAVAPSRSYQLAAQAVSSSRSFESSYSPRMMLVMPSARNASMKRKLMYAAACMVLVVSMVASVQTLIVNTQATEQIATLGAAVQSSDHQGIAEGSGSQPAEQSVDQDAMLSYQVANPEHPRYIRIPALDVFARIKNTGVDNNGAVDAPWNIHDASWFNQSAVPGSPRGASLLLGHVSGWSGPGVFKEISKLAAGSEFSIEKGSGEIVNYQVVRGEEVPLAQVDMAAVLNAESQTEHDLKMMTCSGRYNAETESYESRYIVYAKRLN